MGWFSSSKTAEPEKLDEEVKVIQKNHELEGEIKEAVAQRNFEKAAKVQTELNELRKGKFYFINREKTTIFNTEHSKLCGVID